MRNLLLVISGPSGVGKGTIVKRLLKDGNYSLSVSCTTRSPRPGESDGREYFFITDEKFSEMIKNDGFLEYSGHFGHYYGTPRAFVAEKLKSSDVILEIDVNGALNVKKAYPDAVLIMVAPPDKEELKKRLLGRGSETEESIAGRLARTDYELGLACRYDYTVVNGDLNAAVLEIENIIKEEKEK